MSVNTFLLIGTIGISVAAWRNQGLFQKLILHPYTVVTHRQYYRLLSSGFIHQGWMHLLFNMLALFFFGRNVEVIFQYISPDYGSLLYIVFYLTAIIASDLTTIRKNKENQNYFSLGASGGVSAVVFCWILFFPLETIYIYFIPLPGFILGFLYIIYSYYQSKNESSHINHDAHLFGAAYGILFTVIAYPQVLPQFFEQLSNFKLF